jgi:acetyl-CoA carboxylase / biotin carboxylase 1
MGFATHDLAIFLQVKIPPESDLITIPDEIYRAACVYTTEEAIASCQVVGYPAMIKASWGGGGKGIRKVCFLCGQLCSM